MTPLRNQTKQFEPTASIPIVVDPPKETPATFAYKLFSFFVSGLVLGVGIGAYALYSTTSTPTIESPDPLVVYVSQDIETTRLTTSTTIVAAQETHLDEPSTTTQPVKEIMRVQALPPSQPASTTTIETTETRPPSTNSTSVQESSTTTIQQGSGSTGSQPENRNGGKDGRKP